MRQVLIVEDGWLLAEDLKGDLEERGFAVLGPAMTSSDAIAILSDHTPFLALVDTQLKDGSSEVVMRRCDELGISAVVFSGHSGHDLPEFAQGRTLLGKPFSGSDLDALLAQFSEK
jgi:ActR/RegA family two-component response regulator